MQMAYMDLSLFLAAECASDRDNVIFTERLRHDCQAALMRLHCSPQMVQQRCDFPKPCNALARHDSLRGNHVMPWLDMTHSERSGLATGIDSQECPAGNVWQEQELSP